RQGLRTAAMFWPGSEVAIAGQRPTYWLTYDHDKPHAERVAQVLAWLDVPEAERPAFLTLYFAAVDDAGHDFGPLAPETHDALLDVDRHIGDLMAGLAARGLEREVSVVIVSDHGMTEISEQRLVYLDDAIAPADAPHDFLGPVAGLRPPAGEIESCVSRLRALPHVRVFRKTDLPASAGYTHSNRIPDVLVIADEGWEVTTRAAAANRNWAKSRGNHGFDPAYGSMGATLIARGPRLPRGAVFPAADNIHVYNLLCALLEIQPAPNDGDDRLARLLVRPYASP
ncbi:MAG TPA: nucleotide pyrophosphatase/phosphodiesterase family protein, partial [Opitutaceae bacterium]